MKITKQNPVVAGDVQAADNTQQSTDQGVIAEPNAFVQMLKPNSPDAAKAQANALKSLTMSLGSMSNIVKGPPDLAKIAKRGAEVLALTDAALPDTAAWKAAGPEIQEAVIAWGKSFAEAAGPIVEQLSALYQGAVHAKDKKQADAIYEAVTAWPLA